jgi:Flp pilus assembly protein TadB
VLLRLLSGIFTAVFVPLGLIFLIALGAVGLPFAVLGIACAATFAFSLRQERRRRERRQLRATAEVVEARINHGVQLNKRRALALTVRFEPAGTVSGSFFWLPSDPIGDRIDVVYDPADPANFAPASIGGDGR